MTTVPLDDVPESAVLQPAEQEGAVFSRQVVQALDQLRPGQRQALELVCAAGLSYEEAAVVVNCSVGTIKSRLWRARRQMEDMLKGVPLAQALETGTSKDSDSDLDEPVPQN